MSLRQQSTSVPVLGTLYYTLGYTYAHSIDNTSGFRNNNTGQVPFFQPQIYRASSDFDLRNVLTFSGGWDLPFNRGPQKLVKGWSLYPNLSWRSGFPLSVNAGLNTLNGDPGPSGAGDAGIVNADLVSPIRYLDPHKKQTINGHTGFFFYDPNSFAGPASGYGTAPRNLLRGPGRTNMDLALTKETPFFSERVKFKFGLDAFNLFNHTEFRALSGNFASSRLGQAISTYDPRILQLSAHVSF